jgi:hypothetical protein
MIPAIYNQNVVVKRRISVGRDVLNNPTYGQPTGGVGWSTVYASMPARLAFSSKAIQFAQTGERPSPNGVVYYGTDYALLVEDRVLTPDGIEYTVTSIVPGYVTNTVIDHYEAICALP